MESGNEMPFRRERYLADWDAISKRIRKRSRGRCEFYENGVRCKARQHQAHPITGSWVILTVMHLDHNPMNCADDNLLAACQFHHLRYDAKFHAKNAAQTRRRKKIQAGQGELL